MSVTDQIQIIAGQVREAAAAKRTLRITGAGSKAFYGQSLEGETLETRSHQGISAYEPTELVITARCGTSLAEIEKALADSGQILPFEPPYFGGNATFGGAIASGLSGPRRAANNGYYGAVRDYVLEIGRASCRERV